jgi:hypothetical protein
MTIAPRPPAEEHAGNPTATKRTGRPSKKTVIIAAALVALLLAGGGTAAAVTSHNNQVAADAAVAEAASSKKLKAKLAEIDIATTDLETVTAEALALADSLNGKAAYWAGFADDVALANLEGKRTSLVATVDSTTSEAQAKAQAAQDQAVGANRLYVIALVQLDIYERASETITAARSDFSKTINDTASNAVAYAIAERDAHPEVDVPLIDAVNTAVNATNDAIAKSGDVAVAVDGIVTARQAFQANVAAKLQAVAEQEQANAGGGGDSSDDTGSDGSGSGNSDSGDTGTGGSGGGGGESGGGGSPSDGGSSGGGSAPDSGPATSPLLLNVTGSSCTYDGSQEASYGSYLNVPGVDLLTYNTYEIAGYGWGVSWYCDYGF